MKKNLVPLLGIAFVVAIVATGLFYGLFIGRLRNASRQPSLTVVVAARTVERGSVLTPADLKVAPWAGDSPKTALPSTSAAVGQTVLETLHEGELVLTPKLASGAGAAAVVPAGMRVVSIHVADSSGVVAMLRPGFRVDVQVITRRVEGGPENLRMILQNIEVLSTSPPENNRPVVNLVVRPADADSIGLADSTARIRLALRNPSEPDGAPRPALTVSNLLTAPASAALAVKPGAPTPPAVAIPKARPGTATTAALR